MESSRSKRLLPVRTVVARTGVPAHLLRTWERRYEAVRPGRTRGGQRRYSESDVVRIRLLRDAVARGESISAVARLSDAELRDRAGPPAPISPAADVVDADPGILARRRAALTAVEERDGALLRRIIRRDALVHSSPAFLEAFLSPLLHDIGAGWARGTLGVAEEHLASQVIREVVGEMVQAANPSPPSPMVVLTTPSGQRHEFGALFAALIACRSGWHALYPGPDLPAKEIARLARREGAGAVGLSVLHPSGSDDLLGELGRLRDELHGATRLVVGGHDEGLAIAAVLEEVEPLRSLSAFELWLRDS